MDFGKKNFISSSSNYCAHFTLQIYSQPTVPLLQEMGATVIDDLLYIAGGVDNEDNIRSSVIRINLGTDKEVVASFNKEIMAPMNFSRSSFSLFELPCYN